MTLPRIAVLIGSTRPRRIGPQIAQWVAETGRPLVDGAVEIVDLKEWPLPMDDEPGIPALGDYTSEYSRAWSRKIAGFDAMVFVTPQYNWGYPAPLKNAIDHLYREWQRKPAVIVSYGSRGGGKCADQLRQVLDGLGMRPVATMPGFVLGRDRVEENAGTIDPAEVFAAHLGDLQQAFAELALALHDADRPE